MSIQNPPQGASRSNAFVEDVLAEALNLAYTVGNNIFANPVLVKNLGAEQQITLTINIAQDQNNTLLKYTLDGVNFVEIGKIEKDINLVVKVPVKTGDQLNLQLDKSATIVYCRIGQPL